MQYYFLFSADWIIRAVACKLTVYYHSSCLLLWFISYITCCVPSPHLERRFVVIIMHILDDYHQCILYRTLRLVALHLFICIIISHLQTSKSSSSHGGILIIIHSESSFINALIEQPNYGVITCMN